MNGKKLSVKSDNNNFALLKCTSNYPATPENGNILMNPHMRDLFKCEVGFRPYAMLGVFFIAAVSMSRQLENILLYLEKMGELISAFSLEQMK